MKYRFKLGSLILTFVILATEFSFAGEKENFLPRKDFLIYLDCYSEDLKELIKVEIDLSEQKVISPEHLQWGKYMTYKKSGMDRIYLQNHEKNPIEIWTIHQESGRMSICQEDYASGHCKSFQCYNNKTLIF
jgi:hypothetical protein